MKTIRCAIYTRKSTEEGLDQVFNTLDAQREACEAYVKSQAGEGWRTLPAHYDDGGFSGGNMDRPAIQQLLADVDAGRIDAILVYKADRLTRSLMDFARIVERLDARGVSFVSVTQAFNTTSSMGRLTLNVLLSFAQFEREVTGERIRDKIAASKAKGMWMGGNVPLGYDLEDRRLNVNEKEAEQVRLIFSRYLELGSGVELAKELRTQGVVSKRWISRSGQERGGLPFSCGALYYLLQNRLYLGEIVHRRLRHVGEHPPIVSSELFEAVQEALASRRREKRDRPRRAAECPLAGLVVGADGQPLTTSFSYGRGGRRYRYYVSGSLNPARPPDASAPVRVPAGPLERLVKASIERLRERQVSWNDLKDVVSRVELRSRSIQLVLRAQSLLEPCEPVNSAVGRLRGRVAPDRLEWDGELIRLVADRSARFRGGRTEADASVSCDAPDQEAGSLLRSAHRLLGQHSMSPLDPAAHAFAVAPQFQRQRRVMALGLLAPQLQKSLLQGRFVGSAERLLSSFPLAWQDQMRMVADGLSPGATSASS